MPLPTFSAPASDQSASADTTRIVLRQRVPNAPLVHDQIQYANSIAKAVLDRPTTEDLRDIKAGDVITSESGTERLVVEVVSVEDGKIEIKYHMTQRVPTGEITGRFNRLNGEALTEEEIVKNTKIGEDMSYIDPKIEQAIELGHAAVDDPRITVRLEDKVTSHNKLEYIVISSQRHEIITNVKDGSWMRQILKAPQAA